jgi:hypothetical protein
VRGDSIGPTVLPHYLPSAAFYFSNSSLFFHIRFNQPTLTFTSSLGRGSSPPLIRTAQLLLQSLLSRPLSAAAVGDPAPHRLTSPTDDSFQCCFLDSTGTEKPHNLVNRSKRCCCNLGWAWTIGLNLPLAYISCVQSCAAGKQVDSGVCTSVPPTACRGYLVQETASLSRSRSQGIVQPQPRIGFTAAGRTARQPEDLRKPRGRP